MARIAVFSVFYNRAKWVAKSVESLVAQDYADLDIVLVDDGSTDNTLAELRKFEGGRVRVVAHANMGFTPSIRTTIAATDCDYVAIHGSGDISLPQRITRQAALLDAQQDIGVVGCATEQLDVATGARLSIFRPPVTGDSVRTLLKRHIYLHGEIMFRRALYDQVGGYRPFFVYAQDQDLLCRMAQHTRFGSVDDVLYARYQRMEDSVSATPSRLLKQRLLADFARHCLRERLAGRQDPLEEHGALAPLLAPHSAQTLRQLRQIALRAWRNGDKNQARHFFEAAQTLRAHPISAFGLMALR